MTVAFLIQHLQLVTQPAKGDLATALGGTVGLAVRSTLTLAVVGIGLLAIHWLGERASHEPVSVEARRNGDGRYRWLVGEVTAGAGQWLGRVTRFSLSLAVLLAIALIWLLGTPLLPPGSPRELVHNLSALAGQVGGSLLVVALALGLGRQLQKGVVKSLGRGDVNRNLALLAGRMIYIGTLALAFIIILGIWNTGLVFPVALLGALTVALSLALQDVLRNLVAGVYLLLERPFVIGDYISSNSYSGEVEDIQIRYTALRTADGQRVLIPNQLIFSSPMTNQSVYRQRRMGLTIMLPDTGPDGVENASAAIGEALRALPEIDQSQAPLVLLSSAAAGKMELRAAFWLPQNKFGEQARVVSAAIERIRTALPEAEVSGAESGVGAAV